MAETAGGYDSGITVASSAMFAFVTATFILTTEITCSKVLVLLISSLLIAVAQCWRWRCSTGRRCRPSRSMLLSLRSVCSINPFRVNVDWLRKIFKQCEHPTYISGLKSPTIHFALVSLITHAAYQLCNTLLPVESHGDRLIVMAEEARESRVCST